MTILVDTGGSWDRDFLQMKLKEKDLEPADISFVIGTHGHSDHVGNLNLFPSATMIVGYDVNQGDRYLPNKLAEGQAYSIDEYVSLHSSHTFQFLSNFIKQIIIPNNSYPYFNLLNVCNVNNPNF